MRFQQLRPRGVPEGHPEIWAVAPATGTASKKTPAPRQGRWKPRWSSGAIARNPAPPPLRGGSFAGAGSGGWRHRLISSFPPGCGSTAAFPERRGASPARTPPESLQSNRGGLTEEMLPDVQESVSSRPSIDRFLSKTKALRPETRPLPSPTRPLPSPTRALPFPTRPLPVPTRPLPVPTRPVPVPTRSLRAATSPLPGSTVALRYPPASLRGESAPLRAPGIGVPFASFPN